MQMTSDDIIASEQFLLSGRPGIVSSQLSTHDGRPSCESLFLKRAEDSGLVTKLPVSAQSCPAPEVPLRGLALNLQHR